MDENPVPLIRLLLARLERISADSIWAHRASGVRGALFKALDTLEHGGTVSRSKLEALTSTGFHILEEVLKENARKGTVRR